MDKYFVLWGSEDGGRVEEIEKAELEKRLAENYWGNRRVIGDLPRTSSGRIESDFNYWDNAIVIIKGQVVVPIQKKVVVQLELP